ncbi:hypothetical protein [Phenylobacterium sp.]|uniref:hypothetical protein n=1 Tax=Phenylobacterium sp. TaxID=1871053 RepID=UPI002734EB3E|nr:hypothetical protein [Phenylobacterium sp.]MDP3853176.1 hypothetical protein [Phenylobacterium sp.]
MTAPVATHRAWCPGARAAYDYALLANLHPLTKPMVFADLSALARRIHRDRQGQALQLRNDRVHLAFDGSIRRVVAVYGEDQVGQRTRFIGYAWLNGRDWEALQAALDAAEPMARQTARRAA